mmetsp:Transcript_43692/g.75585  ORF Transcript_43692/g.75585 Transcript_43692/m.75585 type:complete len:91 (+) Transcript_43692:62-334(+)
MADVFGRAATVVFTGRLRRRWGRQWYEPRCFGRRAQQLSHQWIGEFGAASARHRQNARGGCCRARAADGGFELAVLGAAIQQFWFGTGTL